jgi:acetylornithine deacetylase
MSPAIDVLRDLVALPSVNPLDTLPLDETHGESRVVDYVADFCASRGLDCSRQPCLPGRDNLIVRLEGRNPGPGIVLEAHTDTVAVEHMNIPPFEPNVRDGKVFGRGSCDCKASLAAMLTALTEVANQGAPPLSCTLLCTIDEEYQFAGVKCAIDTGLQAALGVVGEPTGLDIVIAHKGALRMKLATRGLSVHSSQPDLGVNAIYAMTKVIGAVEQYGETLSDYPPHPLVGRPTVSVGMIAGGQAVNIVPDLCEAWVDRRLLPAEEPEAALNEFAAFLEGAADCPLEITTLLADPGMEVPRDSPVAKLACAAAEAAFGHATVRGVQYGTDASKLVAAGIPTVVCGPGDIAQAHTAVEWVDTEQVEAAVRFYTQLMTLDSYPDR